MSYRSQLSTARAWSYQGVRWWGRMEPAEIPPDQTDILRVVQEQDRIDNLAAYYYGDQSMGWVLKLANGIWLEPNQLIPGMELRIPLVSRLLTLGVLKA